MLLATPQETTDIFNDMAQIIDGRNANSVYIAIAILLVHMETHGGCPDQNEVLTGMAHNMKIARDMFNETETHEQN